MHRLRYIDMNEISFRNVWISLAIIVPIGGAGMFVLRDDPDAKGMLVFVLIATGIALRHYLDRHELRDHEED